MPELTRLYGVNLDDLADVLGSGDGAYLDELVRRYAGRIASSERNLPPGAVAESLNRWVFDPPAQVGPTAAGDAQALAFELLCMDAARRAGVPARLTGDVPIPPVVAMADEIDFLDVELNFDLLESRLSSRRTCGIVFQSPSLDVGYLAYRELRRVRGALRIDKQQLAGLPFFAAFVPAVRLAARHELDLIAISS